MAANETKGQSNSVEELLQELIFWARFTVRDEAKKWFEDRLDSDEKKWVYEAFDGKASSRDIEKITGVSDTTILEWAKQWEELGIVWGVGEGRQRRIRKIVPLQSVGVKVPSLPKQKKE